MDAVGVTRGGRCGPQRVPEAEGAAVRGRPLVAGAGPASLRAARQPGQAPRRERGALLALAGARVKMSVREPSSTPGPWGAPPACPPGFLVCPAVVAPPPRRPLLALGSTTLWAPGDPMAAATSLASESPFHVACVHVCVGHTHRHDTAVISAGKLLPQMAIRSLPRSWRSLLPGGAADASPERTARPRTPPPRPAQPPPSRGIGRRPLPHPGTRRRRAGSRTPRSRAAAGEREDPSSYGEGPVRPLKRVGPRAVVMLLGPRPGFPGRTTLRTGPVAPATLCTHELAASSPTSGVVTAIHGTGILRNAPQVRWGAKVRHTGRCCGLDLSERLRPYSRGDANLCDHGCPGLLVSGKSPAELLLDRARIHHSLGDAAADEARLSSGHGTRGLHGLFQAPA